MIKSKQSRELQPWTLQHGSKELTAVAILGYQFALYRVVVSLSFLRGNQSCFIAIFLFLADQIFFKSYVHQQQFCLRSLTSCHKMYKLKKN